MMEEEVGSAIASDSNNDLENIDAHSNTKDDAVGYSKTFLLGLFSLFDIDRYDAAVVLAAIEKVDARYSQTVDVNVFVQSYAKEWAHVLVLLWENYFELYHGLKEPLVDDNDSDKNQENGDDKEAMEEEKDIDKDAADVERRKQLLEDRRRPQYFLFLSFLFFIMSITDREELSRFVYWMWYVNHRASRRKDHPSPVATLETLMDMIPVLWGSKPGHKKLVPKLIIKVRKSTRHLDMDEFDASKFHILDFSTKGSWTTPIRKMQREVKWRFATSVVWFRVIEKVHSTFKDDIDVALDRLDCPRRKRGTKVYNDKGERKLVRHYVRKFLKLIKSFLDLPRGEDLNTKRMNPLLAYAYPIVEYVRRLGSRFGLSNEQIHPSVESKDGGSGDEKKGDGGRDGNEGKDKGYSGNERRVRMEGEKADEVSLEKKYRVALIVNVDVLNSKAVSAKERALQRIDQAKDCVYDDFDFDISLLSKK